MTSLAGRRVVITRAAAQVDESAELIASFGATPIVIPLIEVLDEPGDLATLGELDLSTFDWVIVTSPNGAERVGPRLAEGRGPRVAAVGLSTEKALPRCDLTPATQSAAGLLEEFPAGPGRALVVQAFDAAPTLVSGLQARGWLVKALRPYRTRAIPPTDQQLTSAIESDAVLFASGSAARAWVAAFGQRTPPVVIAIGEQTATAAERAGLKVSAVSADHSMYGMLVTLSRYFSGRQ
jgi:uroporphyrinogen-III synthase